MASDKDILGKADALLRRHNSPGSDTGSVPVLTDLVDAPARSPDAPGRAPDTASKATEDAAELAREVFTRVMAEVEGRLAADLEKRLAQHLVAQVHPAVVSALGDLRQELANAIGDAVAEAIARRHLK